MTPSAAPAAPRKSRHTTNHRRLVTYRLCSYSGCETLRARVVTADAGALYDGGVHAIDLAGFRPMVATPGDPDRGEASDPKNGAPIAAIGDVAIDIAYGGSCTAGKRDDIDFYARVMAEADRAGRRVAPGVRPPIVSGTRSETIVCVSVSLPTFISINLPST